MLHDEFLERGKMSFKNNIERLFKITKITIRYLVKDLPSFNNPDFYFQVFATILITWLVDWIKDLLINNLAIMFLIFFIFIYNLFFKDKK